MRDRVREEENGSLGAGFDTLSNLTAVAPGPPGEPPQFALPEVEGPFKLAEGWAHRRLADFHLGLTTAISASEAALRGHLSNAARKITPPPY